MTDNNNFNTGSKPFFGRQWAINKLARYVGSDGHKTDGFSTDSAVPRTVLIVGSSGSGKTSLISHLVRNKNDEVIYPQICCTIYADRLSNPFELLLSVHAQIKSFFKTHGFSFDACSTSEQQPSSGGYQDFTTLNQHFRSLVLQPLQSLNGQFGSKLILLIDNIDIPFLSGNSQQQQQHLLNSNSAIDMNDSNVSSSLSDGSSKDNLTSIGNVAFTNIPIVDLFLQNQTSLPAWLLLVASCSRRSKAVIRGMAAYTACRKFILDDTKRQDVAEDLKGYCQMRVSSSLNVFLGDNKTVSEMIDKLIIKSNGCILYLEKTFDLLLSRCLSASDIVQLPATLNGFYLWLCEHAFTGVDYQQEVRPFFTALVREKSLPFDDALHAAFPYLGHLLQTRPLLEHVLTISSSGNNGIIDALSPSSRTGPVLTVVSFFHPSFASWLTDVKLCTRRFVVDTPDNSNLSAGPADGGQQYHKQTDSNDKATSNPTATTESPCKAQQQQHQQQKAVSLPKMQPLAAVVRMDGPVHLFGPSYSSQKQTKSGGSIAPLPLSDSVDDFRKQLFSAIENGDPEACQDAIRRSNNNSRTSVSSTISNIELSSQHQKSSIPIEIRDEFLQTPLILASKCGYEKIVQFFIDLGANVEACDCDGWTPLRSAAWSGHMGVLELLLKANANVKSSLPVLPDGELRNNGNTPLDAAILNGQLEAARRLLQWGAEVNAVDNDGRTPLIVACVACRVEIVRLLLSLGADLNVTDVLGRTCLHMALLQGPLSPAEEDGLVDVLNVLLDAGCVVDAVDNEGTSPLHLAASRGLVQACEVLLENDCDVDLADSYGRTALFLAASQGHEDALRMLLYWNASVDAIDAQGWSALSVAARFGDVGCVEMLLDRGLDENHCDNDGCSPLHLAAAGSHIRICEILIERGARIDTLSSSGRSPLMVGAAAGHVPVVTCLLRNGANPLLVDVTGQDALRMAVAAEHWPVVRVLARYTDVNTPDPAGHPPLFTAAFTNSTSLATVLLQSGAHPNLCDANGRSPLHVAAWQGHSEVLKILLNFGANVNAVDNEGRSALHSAAWQGNLTACRLLLEAGAAVDHVCAQGATALCIAAQEGHANLLQLLLDFGANPSHVDQYGRTALRMALKNSHMEVVRILEGVGEVTAGTGNSQTSNDSALTRNTYTSGSGGGGDNNRPISSSGAMVSSFSGGGAGGIIVSPAGTGIGNNTAENTGSQLLQINQVDSSTGDSQSGGGSLSFGVTTNDGMIMASNSHEKIINGTRSFERGMRQRRSIANAHNIAASRGGMSGGPMMAPIEDVESQFVRGANFRRSLQPQPVSVAPGTHYNRFGGGGAGGQQQQFISGGIEYDDDCMNNYAALSTAFEGFNISSLDEQAERLFQESYARAGSMFTTTGNANNHGDYLVPNCCQPSAMQISANGGTFPSHLVAPLQSGVPILPGMPSGNKGTNAALNGGNAGAAGSHNKPQSRFLSSLLKKMLPGKQKIKQQHSSGVAK